MDLLGSDSKEKGSAPPRYHYRQQADYALTQPPQIGRQRALACQVLALQDALPVHAGEAWVMSRLGLDGELPALPRRDVAPLPFQTNRRHLSFFNRLKCLSFVGRRVDLRASGPYPL